MEAAFYEKLADGSMQCQLCPHFCVIEPGTRGRCRVRENQNGKLNALTYSQPASVAMDPVEKKPLYHFHPGSQILSLGSWGCNFHCTFCQNWNISQNEVKTETLAPQEAARLAKQGDSIGIAYTYNEPFIWWEYLRDCGKAVRDAGLKNVLVTNGYINPEPLEEILPLVDAMNIDIKSFSEKFYREQCGGRLEPVLKTAERAAKSCHVELTTLVIPGYNDHPKELDEIASWIAKHCGEDTPAHVSAYFPRYKLNAKTTTADLVLKARNIFKRHLKFVYAGNTQGVEGHDTECAACGSKLISRLGYATETPGLREDGKCASCGAGNNIITD